MPFGPVDPQLDLVALEERLLARWRNGDLTARVADARKDGDPWIFYEGPPTANGRPGLHHVWARAFKDLYPRFQTMQGHRVPRKGGWDCHGLAVELEIEKELGLHSKHEIESYGISEFNQKCRDSVQRYVEDWTALTARAGVWIDTKDAYWTLSNDYIESVWWLVKQMWDKDLIYEGHRVTPYCARCGTALSSHEVAQGYRDVVDPSVYVRFPLLDRSTAPGTTEPEADGADLLVWTTTPWTLISNVAAAVGPAISYVRIADPAGGRDLILAEAAQARRYPDAAVLDRLDGADLVGRRYVRPFGVLPLDDAGQRIVGADFVSTDEGSGIVHIAPAFGEDDAAIAREAGLPVLNPVDVDGAFDHSVPTFTGRFVKDADRDIISDLAERHLLVAEEAYEHSYPHCWRCGTPLIYWAKTSWFARTSERREELLRENERIGWHPEHLKHGRFGKWLEGNVDWALSRDRYWGTPLPVWRCAEGHDTCIGSVAELAELTGTDLSDLDLHRPYIDAVRFPCPQCGTRAQRALPVLDAWFDSGSMPSAQHHYPFEGTTSFDESFPADFICEAIDQTRGWFYSLLAVNTLVFDSTPYLDVVCLGHIVDADGLKMSKSKGNVIDPWHVFNTFGADALRWYFFSSGQPWTPRRVFEDGIRESTRQTLITLWNVFSFHVTYADLDRWIPEEQPVRPTHVLDRWILSELDDTVRSVTDGLAQFDGLAAASRLQTFIDDVSNWYVRRSRQRFWKASDPAAHATLQQVLVTTSQLLAPFCPFLAEELYVTLTNDESVHLADWPRPVGDADAALAIQMAAVRQLVALGRAARTDAKAKTRQPLRRALLLHPGADLDDEMRAEIAAELNVKALEDVDTVSDVMTWTVVPNFRALGPRLGAQVNDIKAALIAADGSELKRRLDTYGSFELAGHRITRDEVEVRASRHAAFALAEEGGWAVALDLELDDELRTEGTARDMVRVLNDLRRVARLAIADRIRLRIVAGPTVAAALEAHGATISEEVLAVSLEVVGGVAQAAGSEADGYHVEVDGEPMTVLISPA